MARLIDCIFIDTTISQLLCPHEAHCRDADITYPGCHGACMKMGNVSIYYNEHIFLPLAKTFGEKNIRFIKTVIKSFVRRNKLYILLT